MIPDYEKFLIGKSLRAKDRGLHNIPKLADHLFPFQRSCVEHHLRVGAAGCFLDTGLGKTEIQLEFCQQALEAVNDRALIWTPLAVAWQTERRAKRWGYQARVIRQQSDAGPGINICNYDRRDKIDPMEFAVVSLDEASILKSFTGKTTKAMIEAFHGHRFKLVASATPAPNDHMELGNYAEFLEVLAANEMLSRFFINDTSMASQQWRLKGHAVTAFWDWMASWARMAEKPSDLTATASDDDGFLLPEFQIVYHRTKNGFIDKEFSDLFGIPNMSATSLHDIKRQTSEARAEVVAAEVAKEQNEAWLLWCDTNYEADALLRVLPNSLEVRGSQSIDEKEEKLEAFATGKAKCLIGKPSMIGFGLDWSHCARMAFIGRSYSYEDWYQAVRRCWRYGQKRNLKIHMAIDEAETQIALAIDHKSDDHIRMKKAMVLATRRSTGLSKAIRKLAYNPTTNTRLASWISAV